MEPQTSPAAERLADVVPETIAVWVCPSCGNWAGSSTMPDLASKTNRRSSMRNGADDPSESWGGVTGLRSVCQHCKVQGRDVERVRIEYVSLLQLKHKLAEGIENRYKEEEEAAGVKLKRPDKHTDS